MPEPRTLKGVLRAAASIIGKKKGASVIIWAIIPVIYSVADLTLEGPTLAFAMGILGLILLYLQLLLTSFALSAGIPDYTFAAHGPTKGRFPSAFLVSVIFAVGFLAGLVLLVIPGIILVARWNLTYPILLAEDARAVESLGRSWELTASYSKLAIQVALIELVAFAPAIGVSLLYPEYGPPHPALVLSTNGLFAAASVFGWLLIVALYSLIRQASEQPLATA